MGRRVHVIPGSARGQNLGLYLDLEEKQMSVRVGGSRIAMVPLAVNGSVATLHIALNGDELTVFNKNAPVQTVKLEGLRDDLSRRLALGGFSGQVGTSWRFRNIELRACRQR